MMLKPLSKAEDSIFGSSSLNCCGSLSQCIDLFIIYLTINGKSKKAFEYISENAIATHDKDELAFLINIINVCLAAVGQKDDVDNIAQNLHTIYQKASILTLGEPFLRDHQTKIDEIFNLSTIFKEKTPSVLHDKMFFAHIRDAKEKDPLTHMNEIIEMGVSHYGSFAWGQKIEIDEEFISTLQELISIRDKATSISSCLSKIELKYQEIIIEHNKECDKYAKARWEVLRILGNLPHMAHVAIFRLLTKLVAKNSAYLNEFPKMLYKMPI